MTGCGVFCAQTDQIGVKVRQDFRAPFSFLMTSLFGYWVVTAVRWISSETEGMPSQGMLVRKRMVPLGSSKARPDWAEAPRKVPQDLGTLATQPGVQICGWGGCAGFGERSAA